MLDDLLIKITVARIVHNDAQSFALVNKGLLVTYNVLVLDGSEDSDLVEGILLLFLAQIFEGHLFKRIGLAV